MYTLGKTIGAARCLRAIMLCVIATAGAWAACSLSGLPLRMGLTKIESSAKIIVAWNDNNGGRLAFQLIGKGRDAMAAALFKKLTVDYTRQEALVVACVTVYLLQRETASEYLIVRAARSKNGRRSVEQLRDLAMKAGELSVEPDDATLGDTDPLGCWPRYDFVVGSKSE